MFSYRELDADSFLKWMVVNLITADRLDGNNDFKHLSKITKEFTEVNLTIQINGVDIPVEYFVKQVQENMGLLTRFEAERLISNNLDAMRERMNDIETALDEAHEKILDSVEDMLKL